MKCADIKSSVHGCGARLCCKWLCHLYHISRLSSPHFSSGKSAESPNIVFILAAEFGIGDVTCYGANRCQIETPNIDRMAPDGIRFTDAHVNASVCQPTRVATMTGRYPWRFGSSERGGPWGYVGPGASDIKTVRTKVAALIKQQPAKTGLQRK